MARVPTWTELRLDAKKLARIQKECYNSVHRLLDLDLPALDRKISMLSGRASSSQESTPSIQEESEDASVQNIPFDLHANEASSRYNTHFLTQDHHYHSTMNKTTIAHQPIEQIVTSIVEPVEYMPERREQDVFVPTPPPPPPPPVTTTAIASPSNNTRPVQQPHSNPERHFKSERQSNRRSIDLDDNPHLKAPPLPLSEYLRRNRPEVVRRATRRALYVKTRADRRRFRNETKLINSFKRLRLASAHQPVDNARPHCNSNSTRPTNYNVPAYNVRYKLSEAEMRKLTARTYKRLPEVKMRHKEEVSNQMKALNHKNKLEYARKLTENRKNGIINYPLTTSYDDRSMTSSQSDYSMNSYSGSADMHRW